MTERYLITGAHGFIGRYFVLHLLEHYPKAVLLGVGRSPGQNSTFRHLVSCGDKDVPAPLPEQLRNLDGTRYSYVSCELLSMRCTEILRDFRPTAVIHLAGSSRGISEVEVFSNNVHGTRALLKAIRDSGVRIRLLLLVSSGGVYGNQEKLPIAETAAVEPLGLYSRSKFLSERLAHSFACDSGIPVVTARVFNAFGPGQDEYHFAGRMAGQLAAILAGKSAPVIRVGSLTATRDFLDVRDVCSALGTLLEGSFDGVYNVGSGVERNVGDLLQLFLQTAGLQNALQIQQETDRSPIHRHFADVCRLAQTTFVPQHPLAQTCQEMLGYYAQFVYDQSHHE